MAHGRVLMAHLLRPINYHPRPVACADCWPMVVGQVRVAYTLYRLCPFRNLTFGILLIVQLSAFLFVNGYLTLGVGWEGFSNHFGLEPIEHTQI